MSDAISFEMTCDSFPTFEDFLKGLNKWMSKIEIDADKYGIKLIPSTDTIKYLNRLEVIYNNSRLFDINYYRKYGRTPNQKRTVRGMITIGVQDDGRLLLEPGEELQLNINDRGEVNYLGKHTGLVDAIQDVLPIRDETKVKIISKAFGVDKNSIKMDTFQKRYVIDAHIPELDWESDPMPSRFYKYVPLEVFHKMLLYGTYRMNSIVSQSDTQETFYIGDLMCNDYENEFKRFHGHLSEQKTLISSFSIDYDNAYMWDHYGDNGRGVCLCFSLINNQKLHKIKYVDERKDRLWKFKKQVLKLNEQGIRVHFSNIDNVHRFVKSSYYKPENEWRLIVDYQGEIDYDLYGDRCVSYKDFRFEKQDLPDIGLRLQSILIGYNQPAGTSNFPILAYRARKVFGSELIINRSALKL